MCTYCIMAIPCLIIIISIFCLTKVPCTAAILSPILNFVHHYKSRTTEVTELLCNLHLQNAKNEGTNRKCWVAALVAANY